METAAKKQKVQHPEGKTFLQPMAFMRTTGIRVVTYNVLSPTLCSWQRFPHCQWEDLQELTRWKRVAATLDRAITSTPTVICLQEVDENWAAKLHQHFQSKDWNFVYAMTPNTYWKPIGVAMAWPKALNLEELHFLRPADLINKSALPRHHAHEPDTLWQRMKVRWQHLWKTEEVSDKASEPIEPWRWAEKRQNRLLAARLEMNGRRFVVATYHMPCLFGEAVNRKTKTIHCALLRSLLQKTFGDHPLVLAGDFNTKPEDSELAFMQTGELPTQDVAYPEAVEGEETLNLQHFEASIQLRSAYKEVMGHEPAFTNFAWVEDEAEPFYATLDYIFVTEGVEVTDVKQLPATVATDPVFPTAEQPSDHVLLAADLTIGA